MKKHIKIIIALSAVALIVIGGLLFRPAILYKICTLGGGIHPVPGHDYDCEYPSKDADAKCTYDSECSKDLCIYPTSPTRPYPKDLADNGGRCTKYIGDKNGVTYCHRKEKLTNLDKLLGGENDGAVYCENHVF